jgi:hypothetical protein
MEKSLNEKDSVGQTPTHPPHSIHAEGVKAGIFSTNSMVDTGQISAHFVHSENLLVARTQELTSNANAMLMPMPQAVHTHTHNHST